MNNGQGMGNAVCSFAWHGLFWPYIAQLNVKLDNVSGRETGGNDFDRTTTVEETFRCTASSAAKSF